MLRAALVVVLLGCSSGSSGTRTTDAALDAPPETSAASIPTAILEKSYVQSGLAAYASQGGTCTFSLESVPAPSLVGTWKRTTCRVTHHSDPSRVGASCDAVFDISAGGSAGHQMVDGAGNRYDVAVTGASARPTQATAWLWLDKLATSALVQSFEPTTAGAYRSCSFESSPTRWSVAEWTFTRE